ncbi:DUF6538 domain-containing protein [Ancylobacter sp.]|uniref:DUF6538 domain-containing protein n=1 Tax=Ancylobacter sp. TaxID=1872567 RepID=UPI003BAC7BFE
MPRYIERRRQTYYAVVEVAPSLREKVGKKRLIRSLQTRDLATARERRWAVVAELQKIIEDAKKGVIATPSMVEEALRHRTAILGDRTEENDARYALYRHVEALEERKGYEYALAYAAIATGAETPLDTHLDAWLAEQRFKPRTAGDRRRAIARLMDWGCRTIESVDRVKAGEYVTFMMESRDATWSGDHATVVKYISALSSYWRWMRRKGKITVENPWSEQAPPAPKASHRDGDATEERPFTDVELAKLLAGDAAPILADAMRIAALSGARIDPIICLRAKDCMDGYFRFKPQKNEKRARVVPIHSDLTALVARRVEGKQPDDFIFDDVATPPEGSGRERSMPVSKRFGRYLRDLGLEEMVPGKRRSLVNFHSFRRWFATKAERAGQSPHVIEAVIGHKRGSLLLDRYSGGPSPSDQMRACVEAVKLPSLELAKENTGQERCEPRG